MNFTPAQQHVLLDIARCSIRDALGDACPAPHFDDPALLQPAGCFVSLHETATHRLRGCVGRIDASSPLADVVRRMAQSALEDPRFTRARLTLADLPRIELDISVLSPLQPTAGPTDFDLLNDGIYLTAQGRAGCFLPQVARDTGWTREQLLSRLCTEKMGLAPDAWRGADAELMVFKTVLVGPEPLVARTESASQSAAS
jgi:AmmeMemoRadiSam system protein A